MFDFQICNSPEDLEVVDLLVERCLEERPGDVVEFLERELKAQLSSGPSVNDAPTARWQSQGFSSINSTGSVAEDSACLEQWTQALDAQIHQYLHALHCAEEDGVHPQLQGDQSGRVRLDTSSSQKRGEKDDDSPSSFSSLHPKVTDTHSALRVQANEVLKNIPMVPKKDEHLSSCVPLAPGNGGKGDGGKGDDDTLLRLSEEQRENVEANTLEFQAAVIIDRHDAAVRIQRHARGGLVRKKTSQVLAAPAAERTRLVEQLLGLAPADDDNPAPPPAAPRAAPAPTPAGGPAAPAAAAEVGGGGAAARAPAPGGGVVGEGAVVAVGGAGAAEGGGGAKGAEEIAVERNTRSFKAAVLVLTMVAKGKVKRRAAKKSGPPSDDSDESPRKLVRKENQSMAAQGLDKPKGQKSGGLQILFSTGNLSSSSWATGGDGEETVVMALDLDTPVAAEGGTGRGPFEDQEPSEEALVLAVRTGDLEAIERMHGPQPPPGRNDGAVSEEKPGDGGEGAGAGATEAREEEEEGEGAEDPCGPHCPARAPFLLDLAAGEGQLAAVEWLHARCARGATTQAMDQAAAHGHLGIVEWLHRNRTEGCTKKAMGGAALAEHFDVCDWLNTNRKEGCEFMFLDKAAAVNSMPCMRWMFDVKGQRCTKKAMDTAAGNGNLEMVEFLHEKYKIVGGTFKAMDAAAKGGFLDVVTWLHTNRKEGCTVQAMDGAAAEGHLHVLEWFHENRSEGCTPDAINGAARNGHIECVEWLHSHKREQSTATPIAMADAAGAGHLKVLQFLHKYQGTEIPDLAHQLAGQNFREEVQIWLASVDPKGTGIKL